MSSAEPIPRTAPRALWRVAEAFLTTLFALFGPPEHIAAKHTLTAKPYRLLLTWIRTGEALMRRLLLIEAAAYPKPNTRSLLHPHRTRARKLMGFDAECPEKWRVSFRCFASATLPRSLSNATRPARAHEKQRFHFAWPLAERAEALLRVFNDPTPYAQRLARRLHATPHRARALLAHPPNAPDLIGRDAFGSTGPPADGALHHFSSA